MTTSYIFGISRNVNDLKNYLGFDAEIEESAVCVNATVSKIAIDPQYAQWLSDRLSSGFKGGRIVLDGDEADRVMDELVDIWGGRV